MCLLLRANLGKPTVKAWKKRLATTRRSVRPVHGERGHVVRAHHAPDGKRGAKLIAPVLEFIAE
jgi:hypothetical protein